MGRWEMRQLFLGTTDAQAEVSGQLVLQRRAGDRCLQLAFLHYSLATFTHRRWNRGRLCSAPVSP